jgi:hypothetical protein
MKERILNFKEIPKKYGFNPNRPCPSSSGRKGVLFRKNRKEFYFFLKSFFAGKGGRFLGGFFGMRRLPAVLGWKIAALGWVDFLFNE